jgi:hypothetical protein
VDQRRTGLSRCARLQDFQNAPSLLSQTSIDFGDSAMIDLLLKSHARTDMRTKDGATALDLAGPYGQVLSTVGDVKGYSFNISLQRRRGSRAQLPTVAGDRVGAGESPAANDLNICPGGSAAKRWEGHDAKRPASARKKKPAKAKTERKPEKA